MVNITTNLKMSLDPIARRALCADTPSRGIHPAAEMITGVNPIFPPD
jgi:hypothetical protein